MNWNPWTSAKWLARQILPNSDATPSPSSNTDESNATRSVATPVSKPQEASDMQFSRDQVRSMQRALNARGFKGVDEKALVEDGWWGDNTLHAYLVFKQKNNLSGGATVTQEALDRLYNGTATAASPPPRAGAYALTVEQLALIAGNRKYISRMESFLQFLEKNGDETVQLPQRVSQFIPQILHESGNFRYVKEIWGPTPAQRRYEGRKDLGNFRKGDGKLFMGRDLIQVTGGYNYKELTDWCWARGMDTPDFFKNPKALEDPKWLGLGAFWYWSERVPMRYADEGNNEMVTRCINGGLNGYKDRLQKYDRTALVMLHFGPKDIREFQAHAGLLVDGISGPATRGAMHAFIGKL